jgi:hypothetical protein
MLRAIAADNIKTDCTVNGLLQKPVLWKGPFLMANLPPV